jgi:hypothetical protein
MVKLKAERIACETAMSQDRVTTPALKGRKSVVLLWQKEEKEIKEKLLQEKMSRLKKEDRDKENRAKSWRDNKPKSITSPHQDRLSTYDHHQERVATLRPKSPSVSKHGTLTKRGTSDNLRQEPRKYSIFSIWSTFTKCLHHEVILQNFRVKMILTTSMNSAQIWSQL